MGDRSAPSGLSAAGLSAASSEIAVDPTPTQPIPVVSLPETVTPYRAGRAGRDARAAQGAPGGSRATTAAVGARGRGGRPLRRGFRRLARLVFVCLLGFLGLLGLAAAGLAVVFARLPVPDANAASRAQISRVYYADGRTELGTFGVNRTNMALQEVPQHVRDAVLAAEDRDFYEHRGVAPRSVVRALVNNVRDEDTQGASTITQQYVKNSRLTSERTYTRKVQEVMIALKLEADVPKDQVLENYLNTIYWGRGAYGIAAASQAYFGKDVGRLSVAEGAYLAGIIQSPGRFDPRTNPAGARDRWAYVLDGMVTEGSLSPAQRTRQRFPAVRPRTTEQRLAGPTGYLLTTVQRELASRGIDEEQLETGGLRVITTFDPSAQRAAERAMREGFPRQRTSGVHAGFAAVRPGDGAVVAMYGGPDYVKRSGINDAITTRKSAGSTMKAFALAAALEEGYGLSSRWDGNSPLEADDLEPSKGKLLTRPVDNVGDADYGRVSLREATADSVNTAFVDLTLELGPARVVEAVEKAGLGQDQVQGLDAVPTVALGPAGVAPVDLANAYGTFVAGGQRSSWYTVAEVKEPDGTVRLAADRATEPAFDDAVAADVLAALQDVVEEGSGTAASTLDRPVAGKTGTHQDKTAWFVGCDTGLCAAVDFYREGRDGTELTLDGVGGEESFYGGGYPARIWTDFMQDMPAPEDEDFPPPANLGRLTTAPDSTEVPSSPSATPTRTAPSAPGTPTSPRPTTSSATPRATPTPRGSASPRPTPTSSPTKTSTATPTPTSSPSPRETRIATPRPTKTRTPKPSPTPTRPPSSPEPSPEAVLGLALVASVALRLPVLLAAPLLP